MKPVVALAWSRRELLPALIAALALSGGTARAAALCPEEWNAANTAPFRVPPPEGGEGRALFGWCAEIGALFEVSPQIMTISGQCGTGIEAHFDRGKIPEDYIIVPVDKMIEIRRNYFFSNIVIQGILAHECWHIDQFRREKKEIKITPHHELEADGMAGYALGLLKRDHDFDVRAVIRWLSVRTDHSDGSHGTSEQRQNALSWGFEYGFTEGRQPLKILRQSAQQLAEAA